MSKKLIQEQKLYLKAIEVSKKVNSKYKNWEFPVPNVSTVKWSVNDWSNFIEKYGKKIK